MDQSSLNTIHLALAAISLEAEAEDIGQLRSKLRDTDLEPCALTAFHLFPTLPKEIRDLVWDYALPGPRIVEVSASQCHPYPYPVKMKVTTNERQSQSPSCYYLRVFEVHDVSREAGEILTYQEQENEYRQPQETRSQPKPAVSRRGRLGESRIPGLLHACRESRLRAMNTFEFCLSIHPDPSITFIQWDNYPSPKMPDEAILVPRKKMASPGVRFQPRRDTIYWKIQSSMDGVLRRTIPTEILTSNIRSVAIPSRYYLVNLKDKLFTCDHSPMFRALEELFILSDRASVDSAKNIEESVRRELQGLVWTSMTGAPPSIRVLSTQAFLDLPRWNPICR